MVECSICTDFMQDPRQLPCGHCYCGPPKTCLNTMQHEDTLRCALCGVESRVPIANLKPMYGIREYLQEQMNASNRLLNGGSSGAHNDSETSIIFCQEHQNTEGKYWCKSCESLICNKCIDQGTIHDDHNFVKFLPNIKIIVDEQLQKFSKNKIAAIAILDEKLSLTRELSKQADNRLKFRRDLERERKLILQNWDQLTSIVDEKCKLNQNLKCIEWLLNSPRFDFTQLNEEFDALFVQKEQSTQTSDSKTDSSCQVEPNKAFGRHILESKPESPNIGAASLVTSCTESLAFFSAPTNQKWLSRTYSQSPALTFYEPYLLGVSFPREVQSPNFTNPIGLSGQYNPNSPSGSFYRPLPFDNHNLAYSSTRTSQNVNSGCRTLDSMPSHAESISSSRTTSHSEMFDTHYLTFNPPNISPVVVNFPFNDNQERGIEIRSNFLAAAYSVFSVGVERYGKKLRVHFSLYSELCGKFSVYVWKPNGSKHWVWLDQEFDRETEFKYWKRETSLCWKTIAIMGLIKVEVHVTHDT
ncbi:uncharacterized protein LOC142346008 [Convolutriloba macropyga]|uniref:uncharacterized protein LOC142346008 n=1 Tax=Convolutriloba macropyga TaxID=536237 RepID=UPI003F51B6E2